MGLFLNGSSVRSILPTILNDGKILEGNISSKSFVDGNVDAGLNDSVDNTVDNTVDLSGLYKYIYVGQVDKLSYEEYPTNDIDESKVIYTTTPTVDAHFMSGDNIIYDDQGKEISCSFNSYPVGHLYVIITHNDQSMYVSELELAHWENEIIVSTDSNGSAGIYSPLYAFGYMGLRNTSTNNLSYPSADKVIYVTYPYATGDNVYTSFYEESIESGEALYGTIYQITTNFSTNSYSGEVITVKPSGVTTVSKYERYGRLEEYDVH
jgi:hypothetical protein